MIKALLSFILGVGIGMILMSCFIVAKESEKKDEK